MEHAAKTLVTLGALLLIGLATEALGRRTRLPRVTLMLLFGFLIGPAVFDLLPKGAVQWFPLISNMALVMVGFLLGEKLATSLGRGNGRQVLWISVAVVVVTAAVMLGGLLAAGVSATVAVLLAGIAPATDPAATTDVIDEVEAKGTFTDTLLDVVAIDDAWGLIAFSLFLAIAQSFNGSGAGEALLSGAWELGGALALGAALGIPMAYLTGRLRSGRPTLAEAVGMVFLCGGLALWLDVSFLLAAMAMGAVVARLARHYERPFHAIEGIEWPFMVLFFILAGASFKVVSLAEVGMLGVAYVVLRLVGRLAGGWAGARFGDSNAGMRRWMGAALMPQAGVAMGMALLATERFPELRETVLPVVIGATILFELVGPVLTGMALKRVGEAKS